MFTIYLGNIIIILVMYILYNKYITGFIICLFIPLFSFSQELGFSLNYNRTTMLSDLKFNEKVDASYFPSISINLAFTNTRLDLIYGSNEFTRISNESNILEDLSDNNLNDGNLNMVNSFVSFVINQEVFSFNRATFLVGTGFTYGKVKFFRNFYNSQGYQYEIKNGYYTINNQPVSLDKNFETKIGSDYYYGVNFNTEVNFKLDDKLYFISGFDYNYNLSDNLDLRQESFDFDKQNDQFYSIKFGLRYLISNSSNKFSNRNKINNQQSLPIQILNDTIINPKNDSKDFTLNIPKSFLTSENGVSTDDTFSDEIKNKDFILSESNNNCIYFIVDTLDKSSSKTILFNNKIYHTLYCSESLIDALSFIKLNNIQNSKIINLENSLISNQNAINSSKISTRVNTISSNEIKNQENAKQISKEISTDSSQFSNAKNMNIDDYVDSLDIINSSAFFVVVGVFSNIKNAISCLNTKALDTENYFENNNLFYCFSFSSSKKTDAISFRLNNPHESWIYERK